VKFQCLLFLQDYFEIQRENILCAERILLHALEFDFNVEHSYKYLLAIVKKMSKLGLVKEGNTRELAQVAWNFANDRKITFISFKILLICCSTSA